MYIYLFFVLLYLKIDRSCNKKKKSKHGSKLCDLTREIFVRGVVLIGS
jgi:hypothetical protein